MSASDPDSPPPSPTYRCLALYHASVALQRRKEELSHQAGVRQTSLCTVKKLPKEELDAAFERLHQTGAQNVTPKRSRRGLGESEEDSKPPPPPAPIQENPRCLALYESGVEAQHRLERMRKEAEARRAGASPKKISADQLKESCDRLHKAGAKPATPRRSASPIRDQPQTAPASDRHETLYQHGKHLLTQRRLSWQERYGNTASPQRAPQPPARTSGRFEQLYQTAFATKDNIEKLRARVEDDELRSCTFSPAINQGERSLQTPRPAAPHTPTQLRDLFTEEGGWEDGVQEPRSHKLYRNALESRERLLHEQERRRRQDFRECTFTPRVNRTARPIKDDVFSALYTDAIAQRERRARETDERWGDLTPLGCSLQPLQSPYRASPVASRHTPSRTGDGTPPAASPPPVPAEPAPSPQPQPQPQPPALPPPPPPPATRPEIRLLNSAARAPSPADLLHSRLDYPDPAARPVLYTPPPQDVLLPLPAVRAELEAYALRDAHFAAGLAPPPLAPHSPLASLYASRLPPPPPL